MKLLSFVAAWGGKTVLALVEKESEDACLESYASNSVEKYLQRAKASIGAAVVSAVAGMTLSALAVQGYKSFLPYLVLVFSAAATWRLLSTARLLKTKHA